MIWYGLSWFIMILCACCCRFRLFFIRCVACCTQRILLLGRGHSLQWVFTVKLSKRARIANRTMHITCIWYALSLCKPTAWTVYSLDIWVNWNIDQGSLLVSIVNSTFYQSLTPPNIYSQNCSNHIEENVIEYKEFVPLENIQRNLLSRNLIWLLRRYVSLSRNAQSFTIHTNLKINAAIWNMCRWS